MLTIATPTRRFQRGLGLFVLLWLVAQAALGSTLAPSTPPIVAAHYDDTIRHYGSADGLPQNSVNALLQSRDGYLWLGTYGGLTRFDGSRFSVFRSLAHHGPSSDRILSLLEDARSQLWIGSEDAGVSVYVEGGFQRLALCEARCRVGGLLRDGERVLAATSVGLFAMSSADHSARRIGAETALEFALSTRAGQHYFAGPTGLWRLEGDQLLAVAGPSAQHWDRPTSLSEIDGDLLLGLGADLFRLGDDGWQVFDARKRLPGTTVAVRDPSGTLWLSDISGHTYQQSPGAVPREFVASELGSVQSHWVDREQNLWLGSNGRGLFRIRPSRIALLNNRGTHFDLPGLPVTGDGQGGMWFGLICGGLRHVDRHGAVRAWPQLDQLNTSCPWSFHRSDDGLFVGTSDGKLGRMTDDAQLQLLAQWPGDAIVRSIAPAAERELWVAAGTETMRVQLGADHRVVSQRAQRALSGMRINWIAPAHRGGHWFAGDQGVLRLVDGNVVERWGPAQGLSSRFARTLFEDLDGRLWIGTYGGGLNIVREQQVSHYNEERGLFDDVVSCILPDRAGRLWLSGNRGISMISREMRATAGLAASLTSVGLAAADGLIPAETNGGSQSACHRDDAGRLWFPLLSGFAFIDPERALQGTSIAPTPVIESVRVAGQPVRFDQGLSLDATAHNLEIHYSAPSLTAPDKTQFRFRWSGDTEWTEIGTQRALYYPLLPWGDMQLLIAARIGGSPWSTPVMLQITHALPWHRQAWAWLAMALAAVLLGLTGRRTIGWYLRRRAERDSRPIREHADQLARDNQLLSDQARRDGLTGVANRRHFDQLLEQAVRPSERSQPISLLLIDVDEFKRYNDHFGHLAGDDCLRAVALSMQSAVIEPNVLARFGGEEFVVLMAGANAAAARALAELLHRRISELNRAQVPGAQHARVSVSIGIATQSSGSASAADLIRAADSAMYRAKRLGRDRIEIADSP